MSCVLRVNSRLINFENVEAYNSPLALFKALKSSGVNKLMWTANIGLDDKENSKEWEKVQRVMALAAEKNFRIFVKKTFLLLSILLRILFVKGL